MGIPPAIPAVIAEIIIASRTFTLHKHSMQSKTTDIITGLKIIFIIQIISQKYVKNREKNEIILKL